MGDVLSLIEKAGLLEPAGEGRVRDRSSRGAGGRARSALALCAVLTLGVGVGCDDPFEQLRRPVPDIPGEATLVDFREGPFREPSAFDLVLERLVRVDLSPNWDFLFVIDESGQAAFVPFGAVAEEDALSGLQKVTDTFEGLRQAPSEGYEREAAVPISGGDVLAAVSRQDPGSRFQCRHFAKLEILALDLQERTVRFRFLVNPNCETRALVPGEAGEPG